MIRVELPFHLRTLAQVGTEVQLEVEGPVTQRTLLDALDARYPMLRGTIRNHGSVVRRPMLRFFACELEDAAAEPRAPFHWVPRSELSQYQFPEANRQLIERLVTAAGDAAR